MNLYKHKLAGCVPDVLAHYLKAIGVFRLIAEQADPNVRGFWENDCWNLITTLSEDQLQKFFLEEYQPTPILAPWI